jgi:hypothetical protein
MRFIQWRPEYGWRAFSTELIVVALGVLIALGAEQAVGWLGRQQEVSSLRSAMDEELSDNLAAFQFRLGQQRCLVSRLAELKALRDRALGGETAGVIGEIGRPSVATLRNSVWSARSSEVMDAMPLEVRLDYSYLYDELGSNYEQITQEREAWRSLARFNGVRRLNEEDARTLSELLFRAETIDRVLRYNAPAIQERATRLGIQPSERMRRFLGNADGGLCNPLSR